MFSPNLNNKKSSNFILILFIFFISLTVYFTNVFKSNDQNNAKFIQKTKALPSIYLARINKVKLKNKNGEFKFEKNVNNQVSPWQMVEPRSITANTNFFEKLFNFLSTSNVKKIYPNEKINLSNYSLDKPLAVMDFTLDDGSNIHIDIGLNNTIDNSIYLKTNLVTGILHIDSKIAPIENLNIVDLIESQIFTFDLDTIAHIRIYKNKKNTEPVFEIIKKEDSWITKDGRQININKLDDYIEELSLLKSSHILDKQTEVQKRQINNLRKNSEYIVSIEDINKNTIDYQISGIVKEISDVDLKSEPHFLITNTNSQTAYLIKKEFYSLFDMRTEKLISDEKK